jgi:hypothetical protein
MTLHHGLFVAGASGGVTSAKDARLALAALLSGAGVISGGAVSGNSSGPNMKYDLAAGQFVTARGAAATDGLYVFANDGTITVDSATPAPVSGTRWDLIWVRHKNAIDGFADDASDPILGVTVGTSGSSPTKPYGSVPAGALVLAEAQVHTGDTDATHATITQVAPAAGGRLAKASGSTRYPTSPAVGDYVDDASLGLLRWDGAAWQKFGPGGDTGWLTLPVGASYNTASTAMMRLKQGTVRMKKLVQLNSAANFPTSTDTVVISTGGLPAAFQPSSQVNLLLSGPNVGQSVRCIINSDGSMHFVTQASTGSYVDVAGVRYDVD